MQRGTMLNATPRSGLSNTTGFTPINITRNNSILEGCKILEFDGFIPWDYPDNLVSAEVEACSQRLKGAFVLPLLFLIGGPAWRRSTSRD